MARTPAQKSRLRAARQAKQVETLRRRLAFELLLLQRMLGLSQSQTQVTERKSLTVSDIYGRAVARQALVTMQGAAASGRIAERVEMPAGSVE